MVNQQVGPGFFVQQQVQVESKEMCKMEDKPLELTIEKGSASGDQILLERMAEQRPGMVPGNVIVRLRQQADSRFRREGNDLHTTITVGLKDALLGFRTQITHLDNDQVLLNRQGVTQPMQIVKIENEGMPFKEDPDRRGDMFVTVNVQFPQSLTGDQVNIVGELFGPVPEAEIIRTSEL